MYTRGNTMKKEEYYRRSERGNVLFLILIAVALFAALSYAVTQSSRSGGGDASRETTLVNSSTITQYPASLRTAIVRMTVSNGVTADQLIFDPPSAFGSLSAVQQAQNVFHPSGGGASYTQAPSSVMANNAPGDWRYNAANQILNIGQDVATNAGNDIIAFLPGVSLAICERIHTQLGLSTVLPTETGIVFTAGADKLYTSAAIPAYAATAIIGNSGGSILNAQPQGCFQQPAGTYVYYHVLVER